MLTEKQTRKVTLSWTKKKEEEEKTPNFDDFWQNGEQSFNEGEREMCVCYMLSLMML